MRLSLLPSVVFAFGACSTSPTFSTTSGTTGSTTGAATSSANSTGTSATTTSGAASTSGTTIGSVTGGPATTSTNGTTAGSTSGATTGGSPTTCGTATALSNTSISCCGGQSGFTPTAVFSSFADGGGTVVLADNQGFACSYAQFGGNGVAIALSFETLALQTYDAGFGASGLYALQVNSTGNGSGGSSPAVSGSLSLTAADPDAGLSGSYDLNFCQDVSGSFCDIQGTFSASPCGLCN